MLGAAYEGNSTQNRSNFCHERYDLGAFSEVYAYGDTPEDRDLLGVATKKYYQWQEVGAAGGR